MPSTLPADAARPATSRRLMFWVALLYFSEGLPLGLFFDLFPVHMRQSGVGTAEIGLLSLLGLAWTVKFLWAPLVDAWRGHRLWMAAANLGMACVLAALAWQPQALSAGASWPWVLLAAFPVLTSQATVKGRLYHRLAVSGFASRADAMTACRMIRSQRGQCFVRETAPNATPQRWAVASTRGRQFASR